jgi:hypothetical protein
VLGDGAAREALPHEVAQSLSSSVRPEFAVAETRVAVRVDPLRPIWLVLAKNGELCLVRVVYAVGQGAHDAVLPPSVAQSCASEAEAENGRLVETLTPGSSTRDARRSDVFGVVPNGVRTVTVVSRGGSSRTLAVRHNAYADSFNDPTEVRFVTHGGQRASRHRVPLAAVSQNLSPPVERTESGF